MLALISFFFLLFYSTLFSVLFSYFIIEEEKYNLNIVLFSILGTSVAFILNQFSNIDSSLSYVVSIFIIVYISSNSFNSLNETKKMLFIFPSIIGLMVGFGLIFKVMILMAFLYIIKSSFQHVYSSDDLDLEEYQNKENNK